MPVLAWGAMPSDGNYTPWQNRVATFSCPSDPESQSLDRNIPPKNYVVSHGDFVGWWGEPATLGPFHVGVLYTDSRLLDFAAMDTRLIPINLLGIATTLSAYAQNTDAELLFVRRIVPLLHEKCLACHGHDEAMVK